MEIGAAKWRGVSCLLALRETERERERRIFTSCERVGKRGDGGWKAAGRRLGKPEKRHERQAGQGAAARGGQQKRI